MAGWPSAAHDRLPADGPRARNGRPGVPRRPLAAGRGGWGGFIPHAGPGRGLWHVGGVEVDAGLVWLVAAGERCVSSRATTSTGTPRRISPDDYPYRARWRVSSLLHAADRAGADQESDRRSAAVSVPVAWRPSPVRAAASCTCSWTTRPWPDAGQRWRTPGSGSPTSASPAPARMAGAWRAAARALPHVPLVATEHNQMSWPAGDHTPRARDAARRVDLVFAHGPPARAWAARIGLDDGRLRDGRSSVEGLSAAALPGLPSPRLTLAGRSAATRHQMCSSGSRNSSTQSRRSPEPHQSRQIVLFPARRVPAPGSAGVGALALGGGCSPRCPTQPGCGRPAMVMARWRPCPVPPRPSRCSRSAAWLRPVARPHLYRGWCGLLVRGYGSKTRRQLVTL